VIPIPGFTSTSLISIGLTTTPFRWACAAPPARKTINNDHSTRETQSVPLERTLRHEGRKSTSGFVFILYIAFYFAKLR
jgi:hypothetical protein